MLNLCRFVPKRHATSSVCRATTALITGTPLATSSSSPSSALRVAAALSPAAALTVQRRALSGSASSVAAAAAAAAAAAPPHPSEAFLNGTNGNYVEEMYHAWKSDPASVHQSWHAFFRNVDRGVAPGAAFIPPPSIMPIFPVSAAAMGGAAGAAGAPSEAEIADHIKVVSLVRAFQVNGHRIANLDPLGIFDADLDDSIPPELELKNYGFTEADLNREFRVTSVMQKGFLAGDRPVKLGALVERLQRTYCQNIGFEYMHIQDREQCNWLRERIETDARPKLSHEEKIRIFSRLLGADGFEAFLNKKWKHEKRFGLEGCESLIPGMKAAIDTASNQGVDFVVIGMPHRGRLSVLNNVVGKKQEAIFSEFSQVKAAGDESAGDVKYHLGMSYDTVNEATGRPIHLSLVANPSHLEAVNPVVQGKARAEQFYRKDTERKAVMPVLLHGDAAFAGQGVVFETLGFSDLPHYTTGGTLHIVVNNQIGFTTDPRFARSSPYCTDVAKVVQAPIFHVNADDVEAVVYVCQLAAEWRQQFGKDVVIDLVGYRRHGHNEVDQPNFTQPLMYQRIDAHPRVFSLYAKQLISEGVVSQEFVDQAVGKYMEEAEAAFDRSKDFKMDKKDWLESYWKGFKSSEQLAKIQNTGVDVAALQHVGRVSASYPSDFTPHPQLAKILATRIETIEKGKDIDWATGEALAFGTLLADKFHVRLSGQDVERGTFSQRHHVLHDQRVDGRTHTPLMHLSADQAPYTVTNSHLSEYGVMGFELGYSMANPNSLVLWEAQFGDFANTAQVIIDQFISAGESKWLRQSGLVLLLPHGYEGNGAEHSSARLERFLQMVDDDADVFPNMRHEERNQIQRTNMQVVNCSTPANYYHVLRRQVYREFRKPLVVVTPKYLLRHPLARSTLADMAKDTRFRRVIPEETPAITSQPQDVKRLIFCSGKVYYDIFEGREKAGLKNVALCRVEQIAPFPFDLVQRQAECFPNAEIVWAQEEPKNMGAWSYVQPRIETALKQSKTHPGDRARPKFIGRRPSAATATGKKKTHLAEEAELVKSALTL
ncbi:oxoglutarate dehydrogenase [Capsaspora owczarzaki ATCC 30864]|uniref:2-oxoglutarate dehydrogenase, mitochondrial n=1 Tax=Capsaspora owczarzaki (strain ATCC 30864) TaxID=595528 RepID=A0A0D2VJS8_CAPO3|nr:oxoglutarate dehydrogenase [Capsaspora owczarzaki ATCC 30864]KJE90257.1 oxoglutarate dehydrogenase [Capsaspora owczarzaki ATCC 30864]|eukprot:XP_004364462.1 oxoglutarate dehydrogenase [Capsaspora owczarzaki ATCC 30864]